MLCYHQVVVEALLLVCRSVHAHTLSQNWTLETADTATEHRGVRVQVSGLNNRDHLGLDESETEHVHVCGPRDFT